MSKEIRFIYNRRSAEEHCQCSEPSLSNQCIFDWLDDTIMKLYLEVRHIMLP
jgi:hypothetical protein